MHLHLKKKKKKKKKKEEKEKRVIFTYSLWNAYFTVKMVNHVLN
jgi:hypothetical protein